MLQAAKLMGCHRQAARSLDLASSTCYDTSAALLSLAQQAISKSKGHKGPSMAISPRALSCCQAYQKSSYQVCTFSSRDFVCLSLFGRLGLLGHWRHVSLHLSHSVLVSICQVLQHSSQSDQHAQLCMSTLACHLRFLPVLLCLSGQR